MTRGIRLAEGEDMTLRKFVVVLLTGALALLVLAAGSASTAQDAQPSCERDAVAQSQDALSSHSCNMSSDTGYKSGKPLKIQLVQVDGNAIEWKTANAYLKMAEAASQAGVEIRVVSGFRTMAEQQYLYHCYTSCSCNGCNLAATPGTSNHQSGHAL